MKLLLLSVVFLASIGAAAVNFEAYGRMNVVSDSINYGAGLHRWGHGALRTTGSNWNIVIDFDKTLYGDSAAVPRFCTNRLQAGMRASATFHGLTIVPELHLVRYLDSARVILPLALGEAYRHSELNPGLSLNYSTPYRFEISGSVKHSKNDVTYSDSDPQNTDWSSMNYYGSVLWHSPVGGYLALAGTQRRTSLDAFGYHGDWSRIDLSAGYAPMHLPTRTIVTADLRYSHYTGDLYTGSAIPDRLTARVRTADNVTMNTVINMTFSQSADFYSTTAGFGPFQCALRALYRFDGFGNMPSSVLISGQLTKSAITTRLARLDTRLGLYSGLSLLVTGKLWYGPSSVPNTEGHRTREAIGGGVEFRMRNGATSFIVCEREASTLSTNEVSTRIRGGVGFYPKQF